MYNEACHWKESSDLSSGIYRGDSQIARTVSFRAERSGVEESPEYCQAGCPVRSLDYARDDITVPTLSFRAERSEVEESPEYCQTGYPVRSLDYARDDTTVISLSFPAEHRRPPRHCEGAPAPVAISRCNAVSFCKVVGLLPPAGIFLVPARKIRKKPAWGGFEWIAPAIQATSPRPLQARTFDGAA